MPVQSQPTNSVLMIAPGGQESAYVPQDQVQSYLDKGAEPGIRMTAPDGKQRAIVPYSQQDAYQKKGATWDSHPDNDQFKSSFSIGDDGKPVLNQNDYLSKTEDFLHEGAKSVGEDVVNSAKVAGNLFYPTAVIKDYMAARRSGMGIVDSIQQAIKGKSTAQQIGGMVEGVNNAGNAIGRSVNSELSNLPVEYQAFEKARLQGKSLQEATQAAMAARDQRDQLIDTLHQTATEFKKNPGKVTGHAVVPAILTALGLAEAGGAEAGAAEVGAEDVAGTETVAEESTAAAPKKPGIVQQVVKGKNVAEPQARAAIQDVTGVEAGSAPLRESLKPMIDAAETTKAQLYKAYDDATGIDREALETRLQNTRDQMAKLTGTKGDMLRMQKLKAAETALQNDLKAADELAAEKGVKFEDAEQANIKFKALQDAEKEFFHDQNVIEGNSTQGRAESVNIDNAIKKIQKLADKDKYGANRWDQAFGKGSSDKLLAELGGYQKMGVHAVKAQRIAKFLAGTAGAGLLVEAGRHLAD